MKKLTMGVVAALIATPVLAYDYNPDNYGYNYSGADRADANYSNTTHLNSQIADLEEQLQNANSIIAEQNDRIDSLQRTADQAQQTVRIQNGLINALRNQVVELGGDPDNANYQGPSDSIDDLTDNPFGGGNS